MRKSLAPADASRLVTQPGVRVEPLDRGGMIFDGDILIRFHLPDGQCVEYEARVLERHMAFIDAGNKLDALRQENEMYRRSFGPTIPFDEAIESPRAPLAFSGDSRMTEHDRLISELITCARRAGDDYAVGSDPEEDYRDLSAARQALVAFYEQRTLTAEEADALLDSQKEAWDGKSSRAYPAHLLMANIKLRRLLFP